MELTPEYLAEQEDCINRNFQGYGKNIHDPATLDRFKTISHFIQDYSPTHKLQLSVGSGGFEPHYLNSTYACDVSCLSHNLLLSLGWSGVFFPCSCDHIPYPIHYFDVAICTEVIEHLPSKEIVRATFLELNRVAKRWIVTTPTRDVKEPTHKFIFTEEQLLELALGTNAFIEKKGIFFYIHNGEKKLFD